MNWFEGGRRVRAVLIWLVVAAGVVGWFITPRPPIYFFTLTPDQTWFFENRDCDSPYVERLVNGKIKDSPVRLCFISDEQGNIMFAPASPPSIPLPNIEQGPIHLGPDAKPQTWYYKDGIYNREVSSYIDQRVAEFSVTPEMTEQAYANGLTKYLWKQWAGSVFKYMSATMFVIFLIYLITAILGWILKGFTASKPRV